MTVTIPHFPALFQPAIDEIFAPYGLVAQQSPLVIVCSSAEKYRTLQSQLDDAAIQYAATIDEQMRIGGDSNTPALRLLLHHLFAECIKYNEELEVRIPPQHRQIDCLYLINYVIYQQAKNATIITQADAKIQEQLIEVIQPLDFVYDFPLQLLILTVAKERKQRCQMMIRQLLEPRHCRGTRSQSPSSARQQKECIIEIQDEHSLVVHLTDFYLLRNHFAFTRIEILSDDRVELFFENIGAKQDVVKYLEDRRSERVSMAQAIQDQNEVCFIIQDARKDLPRIQQLKPLKFVLTSDMGKCMFRSQPERDMAIRLWLQCGGEIYDTDNK